ncbi:MAG: hypothetical protein RIA09_19810 [Hoeflea sp.]|uniref:hypothetical protein n=1 Tax=Hoeflea sp. TaxID=1940281 RepID=UPI0032F06254
MNRVENAFSQPEAIFGYISIFFIFFGIFAKDIVSFYLLDYSLRNYYGAGFVLAGGAIAGFLVLSRHRMDVLQLASNKLVVSWLGLLLVIAPLTAYFFNGRVFVSPHAVGFCAALTCYLVSRRITKTILIFVLVAQFATLLYEYHYGVSLTLTTNEAKNVYFNDKMWFIDSTIGLIRAKGMLDSTHDSTWLFFYSALIFELGTIILIFSFCAGWMAQGRLAMMSVGVLCLVSGHRVRIILTLAAIGLLALAIYPDKMISGTMFFFGAFDAESSSNTYRVEATQAAVQYLTGGAGDDDDARYLGSFVLRAIFGASSSSLGPGTVLTEMGYTLFAIEYGIIGLLLMGWTTAVVYNKGRAAKNQSCISLGVFIPILMLSSGTQSASTFFMLWLAVLFLTRLADVKPSSEQVRSLSGEVHDDS